MPQSPVFAWSDFGVFVGTGSEANHHAKLQGASQSTYRAELRAIIHVLKHLATNGVIISDCKSVVQGVQKLLCGEDINRGNDDEDLWTLAKSLLSLRGDLQVEIEWMPSHLEEKDHAKQKAKYLREGGKEEHIDGNVQADVLAKKGANAHSVC